MLCWLAFRAFGVRTGSWVELDSQIYRLAFQLYSFVPSLKRQHAEYCMFLSIIILRVGFNTCQTNPKLLQC